MLGEDLSISVTSLLWINRKKRALEGDGSANGNEGEGESPDEGGSGTSDDISDEGAEIPEVGDEFITDDFNVTSPPNSSLHQNESWPTPLGIDLALATNSCLVAIQALDLYEECLKYTVVDSVTFVNSCIADIRVGLVGLYGVHRHSILGYVTF